MRSLNPLPFHIPTLQLFPFSYTSNIFQTQGIIVQHIITLPKYGRDGLNIRRPPRKYAQIFVRGYYLFREANSFPRAKLEENCELRGADNVQGQISEHIFKAKWRLLWLLSFKYFSQNVATSLSI